MQVLQFFYHAQKQEGMNVIRFDNMVARTADTWAELTARQTKQVAALLVGEGLASVRQRTEEHITKRKKRRPHAAIVHLINTDYYAIRLHLLFILLDLRFRFRLQYLLWRYVTADIYVQLLNSKAAPVDWLFKDGLTLQKFPVVWVRGRKFLGPRENFRSLTYVEYTYAHSRYVDWLNDKSRENLESFFAILYRPERTDVANGSEKYLFDARTPFNTVKADVVPGVFRHLDERIMLTAILYWQGCSADSRTKYPHVYNGVPVEDPCTPKELMIKLAGTARSPVLDETGNSPYHNIMAELNMHNKEAAEQKMKKRTKTG